MKREPIHRIEIDLDSCNGCKVCVDSCFLDVLRWDEENDKPVVAYPEDCVWCLACEDACPVECIEVIPVITAIPGLIPPPY